MGELRHGSCIRPPEARVQTWRGRNRHQGGRSAGAGLSSSAALEVATARALKQLFRLDIDPIELAYVGKSAENDFIGLQSGIMDQFCASLGRQGQALLIDCRDNAHRNVKLPWGTTLVAVHTGVKRNLTHPPITSG